MKQDDQIDVLEESVRRLKARYDLFFAGSVKLAPTVERKRIEIAIHELSKETIRDNGRRFRFNTILARFNQYRELWGRRMREREEGPMEFRRRAAALLSEPEPAETQPPAQQAAPPPRVTSIPSDSYVKVQASSDGETFALLHEQIVAAQRELGTTNLLTREQVATMVQRQAESLRARFGVDAIAFRVETVEGKVKLKAKPVE